MRTTHDVTRREFVTATAGALAGSALLPSTPAVARPTPPADGTVVLFQGDSITDAGRDRAVADPNAARALGSGYPLLAASAALAAHPEACGSTIAASAATRCRTSRPAGPPTP